MGYTLLDNLFDNAHSMEVCKREELTFMRGKVLYKDFFCPIPNMSVVYNCFIKDFDDQFMVVFNQDKYFTFDFSKESKKALMKGCEKIKNGFFSAKNSSWDDAAWDALLELHSYDSFTRIFKKATDIEKKGIHDIYEAITTDDTKGIIEKIDQVLEAVLVCQPDGFETIMEYVSLLLKEFDYLRHLGDEELIDTYVGICELDSKETLDIIETYEPQNQVYEVFTPGTPTISRDKTSKQPIYDDSTGKIVYSTDHGIKLPPSKPKPAVKTEQAPSPRHEATRAKKKQKRDFSSLSYSKQMKDQYDYFTNYTFEFHHDLTVAAQRASMQARDNNTYNPYVRLYYTAFETNRRRH